MTYPGPSFAACPHLSAWRATGWRTLWRMAVEPPAFESLPEHVQLEVRRILAAEARRLLAERLAEIEALRTTAGTHKDAANNHSLDQRPLPVDGQVLLGPVTPATDQHRRRRRRA
jgi:hypothetical protein